MCESFPMTLCTSKHVWPTHCAEISVYGFLQSPGLRRQLPRCASGVNWWNALGRHVSLAFRTASLLQPASCKHPLCVCVTSWLFCVSCHSGCLGFVVRIQGRLAVPSTPSVCVSSSAVCPLCLSSLLLAQSLDRKWEIYFIWLELHCSFLTTGVTSL